MPSRQTSSTAGSNGQNRLPVEVQIQSVRRVVVVVMVVLYLSLDNIR